MKRIILSLLLFSALQVVFAQSNTVSGVVTDASGESLPGVTVRIESSGTGTITDMEGRYTLSELSANEKLTFSFVGMESQTVEIAGKQVINVTLVSSSLGLEEIQVVGYGTQKKVSVTGAISNISNDELMKSPSASVSNSLAGKITGISAIQNTGQPGADEAQLFIRGVPTLGDASPLILVDGVERSFSQLDPEEIESISVLKDASATAVFGVRGANGVIIVTTRRGVIGKPKISVSASVGVQQPTMLIEKLNSYEYAMAHNERMTNDGDVPVFTNEQMLEDFKNGGTIEYPDMDWTDYLMKKLAIQTKENITISGGTEKVRYFVSLGYFFQDGQMKDFESDYDGNYKFNRYNYRSNIDIDVTESTLLKLSVGGRTEKRNTPKTTDASMWKQLNWAHPFAGSGIVDGDWITTSRENDYMPVEVKDPLDAFYGRGYENRTRNTLNLDVELKQDLDFITKGLDFRIKGAYNTTYHQTKVGSAGPDGYITAFLKDANGTDILDDEGNRQIVINKRRDKEILRITENYGKARDWYFETAFNYNRQFGEHNVGGLFLYNQQVVNYPKTSGGANMAYQGIPRNTLGLVGRATYDFRSKYLFEVNLGYNGSENFPEESRFGLFPALSAGWVLTEEAFMKNATFLNFFKVRGSYGLVGNDKYGAQRFLYLPDAWNYDAKGYNFGIDNPNMQAGALEALIGNPNITWEKSLKQNYGFDSRLLDSRLGLSFDYFMERREDILIQRTTFPTFVAASFPVVNMGIVENKGFEAEVKWNQKIGNDFSYRIAFNVSYARNEVVFKDEIPKPHDYLYETGHPVGQSFGRIFNSFASDTLYTDSDPSYPSQGTLYPGDVIYQDLNGDSIVDGLDEKAIGYSSSAPEYNFGLNLGMNYKNWDFSMTWTGVAHASRLLPSYYREPINAQNRNSFKYLIDRRWTPEMQNSAEFPRLSLNSAAHNYGYNADLWLRNSAFIRLKNIEIGYTIKSPALKRIGVSSMRAYANGYNLLTFSEFDYFDPESKPGSDGLYPLVKIYNFGMKFNF